MPTNVECIKNTPFKKKYLKIFPRWETKPLPFPTYTPIQLHCEMPMKIIMQTSPRPSNCKSLVSPLIIKILKQLLTQCLPEVI